MMLAKSSRGLVISIGMIDKPISHNPSGKYAVQNNGAIAMQGK